MAKKIIALGCDHGGYDLKLAIMKMLDAQSDKYEYIDLGAHDASGCDYPDYAHLVCEAIQDGRAECGILFCGTGIGMSMTANKHNGIRAACVSDTFSAKMTREHNNANVLCLGGRVVGEGLAADIVTLFLETPFSNGPRHVTRVGKVNSYDK